jgi:hypothetical protein
MQRFKGCDMGLPWAVAVGHQLSSTRTQNAHVCCDVVYLYGLALLDQQDPLRQ